LKGELARIAAAPPSVVELQNAVDGEIGSRWCPGDERLGSHDLTRDTVFGSAS